MKLLVVLLVIAVAAIAWELMSERTKVAELQNRVVALTTKVNEKPKTTALELQEKCSSQAHAQFIQSGWEKEKLAQFENHYNNSMDRCFMVIQNTDTKTIPGAVGNSKVLVDAFEGKVYGNYMWQSDKVKKYWEVAPIECDVTLPSGEKKVCKSGDEFDELIAVYMGK